MRHASLFSGIGGFDLAAQWMGWENIFHCEKDPFCRQILKYYWPTSDSYEDVKEFEAIKYRGTIDVLTGGFPCQPYSVAGKRKGTADQRHLWPEMFRIICEIRARWVVGENVLGLLNWNRGMVFEQVQADLEVAGYEVQSYILPAAGVGAPHKRDRVWFVAHTDPNRSGLSQGSFARPKDQKDNRQRPQANKAGVPGGTDQNDRMGKDPGRKILSPGIQIPNWFNWPSQPPLCSRNNGISLQLDAITFSKWQDESLKALGNAIVPQVALQIFSTIERLEQQF
jgi:DNA (cytosine-5)-methyltransferase 1